MPEPYRAGHMRDKAFTLADAAASNVLLQLRCCRCHRRINVLAADLLHLHRADRDAYLPPFDCSKCKTSEWIEVKYVCAVMEMDLGRYPVRRLVGIREVPIWRDEKLGDSWPTEVLPRKDIRITRDEITERKRDGEG